MLFAVNKILVGASGIGVGQPTGYLALEGSEHRSARLRRALLQSPKNNGRPQVCSAPSLAGGKSKQWWVETEFVCALRHFFTQAPLVPSSVQAMDL